MILSAIIALAVAISAGWGVTVLIRDDHFGGV